MQPFLENRISRLQVSLSAAAPFPEHLHSQIELLYLFEGSATLSVGGKAQPMQPGDLCVCFPGVVHGYLHAENARALMLIFSPDISVDFPALLERTHPADPLLRRQQLPEDIPLCMEQLLRESCGGFDERVLRGYLQVVLARVLPLLTLNSREPGNTALVYEILIPFQALHGACYPGGAGKSAGCQPFLPVPHLFGAHRHQLPHLSQYAAGRPGLSSAAQHPAQCCRHCL